MDYSSKEYREAFVRYLHCGEPIHLFSKSTIANHLILKQLGHSSHYIWRTKYDEKVRSSHVLRNGKVFSWEHDNHNDHPGADFYCRCWAEPLGDDVYIRQFAVSSVSDITPQWQWYDFVIHYYFGQGRPLTLLDVGMLADVVRLAHTPSKNQVGERIEKELLRGVNENREGSLSNTFSRGYNFFEVAFVLRVSEVYGSYAVEVENNSRYLALRGIVEYNFRDFFQDPIDLFEGITMLPDDIVLFINKLADAKAWDKEQLRFVYEEMVKIAPQDIPSWIHKIAGLGGIPYSITGSWKTKITGSVLCPQ